MAVSGAAGFAAGWRTGFRSWRDRLLSDPRFQRWAAAFPLTRPIAQRRARDLFDICAGFVYSQVLFACVQCRLFDILREGPISAGALAARLSMRVDATQRLLAAASSLRLVEPCGSTLYGLGPLGAAVAGNPGVAAMVQHHALLYADLQDPMALLRGQARATATSLFWPYAKTEGNVPPGIAAAYSRLMAVSQAMLADDVLAAYPVARHRCLLDVGGGDGSFLAAAAARLPHLQLMLFDLAPVIAVAERHLARIGLADRAATFGGDFRRDPLPVGADIVSLVRVLHDHDDEQAMVLLRAVRAALPPGGVLMIAEPMVDERRRDPVGDAYFGLYLLAMGSGRPRRPSEIREMLAAAGFSGTAELPTRQPMLTRLVWGKVLDNR
ncbi:MAG: methyltransferase [Reyranellaceae bacterium]